MESNNRFRQVHLDYHTSALIGDIGKAFDPEQFADTLVRAHVDSVTCFARCHHGMLYYDSQQSPERIHPHLINKQMLKEQIDACRKRGIRVPIYTTVQWDYYTAQQHPEWLVLDGKGYPNAYPLTNTIYEPGFYRSLCVNTPYREFLKLHTQEILDTFPVDGLFYDIVFTTECSCEYCRADMKSKGLNAAKQADRLQFAQQMMDGFKAEMSELVKRSKPDSSLFYNQSHIGPKIHSVKEAFTHFELESLPSGHWGYMHFPITMLYVRGLGKDIVAHTGKFHTMWGDFHSFKNKAALEFECFRMLALNAKCLIGDQLEPSGALSMPVYDLIGSVYEQVEAKEPWCWNATPITEIGVFTTEEFVGGDQNGLPHDMIGIVRMLQEAGHQFDIVDSQSDISKYKVVVMPDRIQVDGALARKLQVYLADGGAVIASYKSGLDPEQEQFALSELGVRYIGDAPYSPDFLVPSGRIGAGLPETEHVMYLQGVQVEEQSGSEVLAVSNVPYFNRTWEHFSSHLHTPSSGQQGYPGIVRNGNAIYFMHPVFTQYHRNAPRWCKQLFLNAVDMLLPEPLVRHDGPSSMLVTLNDQKEQSRMVLHCLHYIPERRSVDIDIIEDVIPLYNIRVTLNVANTVKKVTVVPERQQLDFQGGTGAVSFVIPKLEGHQMIEIEY
jgi:hypothetical protein